MPEQPVQRRLAAILAADAAGYPRPSDDDLLPKLPATLARKSTHQMRRRDLLMLATGALITRRAWAQAGNTYRLGVLVNAHNLSLDAFLKGLRDHGYVEGQNLIIVLRFSGGVAERWAELARELVALKG